MPPLIAVELLDEMMENGFPQHRTEHFEGNDSPTPPSIVSKMLSVVFGKISNSRCSYEEIMNCHLPRSPGISLSVNCFILNNVGFYPCTRFRPWELHQILSFVPPDGQFKQIIYRVEKLKSTLSTLNFS